MSALSHEGALREPFSLTASPDDYVPTAAIERVLADARAALEAGRVPVIAGPTGLGKTLVLQLLGRASEPARRALYVPFCNLAPGELAELVLGLLEWPGGPDPERALLDAARRAAREGRRLLLLVDDAAALSGESAAQLAHWRSASEGALEVALAGLPGPSLRHARDAFGDRAQEILLSGGIRPDELRGYLDARLEAAGAEPAIRDAFDDGALAELARVSGGNPRRLHLAAQAIVRNAYGTRVEAQAAPPPDAAEAAPGAARAPIQPRWDDLASVGEYRFVRGRFVGEAPGGDEVAPVREEILAGRASEDAPRAVDAEPELEVDPEPEAVAPAVEAGLEDGDESAIDGALDDADEAPIDAGLGVDATDDAPPIPPPVYAPPEPRARGGALRWLAAAIAVVAFAVGVWSQLGDEDANVLAPEPVSPVAQERRAAPRVEVPAPRPEPVAPAAVPAPEPEPVLEEETAEVVAEATPAPGIPPQAAASPAPDPPEAIAPDPVEAIAPAPAAAPDPAVPPAETVAIAINATPWAVIEIDGEEIGETPLAGIELTTGRHRFRARMPDGSIRERVVRIDADTSTVVFE